MTCLLAILVFAGEGVFAARKFALILGTNYKGAESIPPLNACESDAELMKYSIIKTGNFDSANVRVLLGSQVTRESLRSAIVDWLANEVQEGDQVFFYFSGHGTYGRDPAAKNGVRSALVMFQRPHVSDDELSDWFKKLSTKKAVIILDCCYSGGIAKKGAATRGAGNVPIPEGQDYTVLQDMEKVHFQDKVVIASSDQGQTSIEIQGYISGGVFTHFFSQSMLNGDLNGDKNVSAYEAFYKARNLTTQEALKFNHKQVPQISGNASGFLFVAAGPSETPPPAPQPVLPPVPIPPVNPVTPPILPDEPQNPSNKKVGKLVIKTTFKQAQLTAGLTVYVDQNVFPHNIDYVGFGAWGHVAQITLSQIPSGVHNVIVKANGYPDQMIKTGIEPNGTTFETLICGAAGKGAISGKVFLENFGSPAGGYIVFIKPMPNAIKATDTSRADGTFAFTDVKPGKYTVFLRGSARAIIKQFDQEISVEADRVTNLDIVLKNALQRR